jgi:hypothetical protein
MDQQHVLTNSIVTSDGLLAPQPILKPLSLTLHFDMHASLRIDTSYNGDTFIFESPSMQTKRQSLPLTAKSARCFVRRLPVSTEAKHLIASIIVSDIWIWGCN